jgi:hypothetical protein
MGPFSKKMSDIDVEAVPAEKSVYSKENGSGDDIPDEGAVHAETFVLGDSWYAKTQRLAGKFGVEQRGIERVPSDERSDAGMSQIGTLVSFPKHYWNTEVTNSKVVAQCQHGRFVLCHWSSRISCLLPWIY